MKTLKTALLNAAAWLEANPDKHIATVLARNAEGKVVSPNSSDACCFCALGRVAAELNLDFDGIYGEDMDEQFRACGVSSRKIYNVNDKKSGCFGNPLVIDYMRQIAERCE